MRKSNPIPFLRAVSWAEGVSFLVLLFVAMPLKYGAGMPAAVRVVGLAHGVLFVVLGVVLIYTVAVARWPVGRGAMVLVAALLPFGPFIIDRRMKRFDEAFRTAAAGEPSI